MTKVKVAIVKVENDDIASAVRKALDLLGGLKAFIKSPKKVLLKPNMSGAYKRKKTREMVQTNPRVLQTLCQVLLENGHKVLVGDNTSSEVKGGTRVALEISGYLPLAEKEGVEVRSLEKNGPIIAAINGKKLKRANIAKDIIEAEAVINVPKMKTHSSTIYTGAIKNLFGTVCGADKTRIHGFALSLNDFSQCIVDLFAFEKPKIVLNVLDAIIAMEGFGPNIPGKPVQMNLILASNDAVALDAVAFTIMGHDPHDVPIIRLAAEQGLGVMALEKIEILGEKIENHRRKFKLPGRIWWKYAPQLISKAAFFFFSKIPVYKSGCTGCQACETACPKLAIKIVRTRDDKPRPKIDYRECIFCFTCAEVCPEIAITRRMKNRRKLLILILFIGVFVIATVAILLLSILL